MKDHEKYGTFGNKPNNDGPKYLISTIGWWSPVVVWSLRFFAVMCIFIMGQIIILAIFITPEESQILNIVYYNIQKPMFISKETGFTITRIAGSFVFGGGFALLGFASIILSNELEKDYSNFKNK